MSYTIQYLESEMAAQGVEVSTLVNCIVQDGVRLSASDLHIEPWENSIAVRARVNGVLTEVLTDLVEGRRDPASLRGRPERLLAEAARAGVPGLKGYNPDAPSPIGSKP